MSNELSERPDVRAQQVTSSMTPACSADLHLRNSQRSYHFSTAQTFYLNQMVCSSPDVPPRQRCIRARFTSLHVRHSGTALGRPVPVLLRCSLSQDAEALGG